VETRASRFRRRNARRPNRGLGALPNGPRRFLAGALSRRFDEPAAIDSASSEGKSLADAWTEVAVERAAGERKEALQAVERR